MANTRKDNPVKVKPIGVVVPNKIARRIVMLRNILKEKRC